MKDWIKKPQNIAFSVICVITTILSVVGGIRLYELLEKGFSVFSVKASIIKLVIDVLLTLCAPFLILISYKIKWMFETRCLHDKHAKDLEELKALVIKQQEEIAELKASLKN